MKRRRFFFPLALFLCACPAMTFAQHDPSPTLQAQRDAMAQVAFLVGRWEGSGWMEMGPQRATFRSAETVEARLDGLALVVEGRHHADVPGRAEPVVVHHALGMLTYDPDAGLYRFNTQLHRGGTGRYDGRVEDGAFIWGMTFGENRIRYTLRLDDAGRWHEVGERSTDGETWTPFFEMTLDRVE